jgi:type I restriction enzyme S subunit
MNAEHLLQHFDRLSEAPDAISRLRGFILDLAMRGKLLEQDHNDEPAGELLKRIQAEKTKKVAALSPVTNNELPFRLPSGWTVARFGDVYSLEYGNNLPAEKRSNTGEYPVYGSNGMVGSHFECFVNSPCIVVGRKGSAGALNLSLTNGCCVTDVAYYCIPPKGLDLAFSFKLFHTLRLDSLGKGVKPGLSRDEAYVLPIAIPSLAEQHRIVAKVDELMALCDQLETAKTEREQSRDRLVAASLQRLNQPAEIAEAFREHAIFTFNNLPRITTRPAHIKQLRQIILNLAVRGKLALQDSNDEPATKLLKVIQAEKGRLIEEGVIRKTKALAPLYPNELPFPLPDSWIWARTENLCEIIVDCPHSTPVFESNGIVCLDTNGFKASGLILHKIRYVSEETYRERVLRLVPRAGDIVFAREGSVGASVIIPEGMKCCLGQRVMLFRPMRGVLSTFFSLSLSEPSSLARLLSLHKGIGAKHVNVADMRNAIIPIPPLAEQSRIVAKVDELMAVCDQLESKLITTQTDSRRLLEAVLHEALAPSREEVA